MIETEERMKRNVFCILSLLILLPAVLRAQESPTPVYLNDVRLGVAAVPLFDALAFGGGYVDYDANLDADYVFGDYAGDRRMLSLFSAEYNRSFGRVFTFSVQLNMGGVWNSVYDYTGRKVGMERGVSVHLIPMARFNYFSRPAFSLYGAAGIGAAVFDDAGDIYAIPTFQITPIGVTFGRKVFGFAEYSGGLSYLGGRLGIGYRF